MEDWKDKFYELYKNLTLEKEKEAILLKRSHIPNKLYRYRPASGKFYVLDEIETGRIHLSHYNELNDPFDGCSLMKSKSLSYYISLNTDANQKIRHELQSVCSKEELESIFGSKEWYLKGIELLAEKRNLLPDKKEAVIKQVKEVFKLYLEINHFFSELVHTSTRIACFTIKSNNLPMWSHYAENHTGVCLEYTPEINNLFIVDHLFPVFYVDCIPDAIDLYYQKKETDGNAYMRMMLNYLLFHKMRDWSYESEWRIIYNATQFLLSQKENYWDKGLVLQFAQPSRVLLGAEMSAEAEKRVREVCEKCNIPAVKMKVTQFGLQEDT